MSDSLRYFSQGDGGGGGVWQQESQKNSLAKVRNKSDQYY